MAKRRIHRHVHVQTYGPTTNTTPDQCIIPNMSIDGPITLEPRPIVWLSSDGTPLPGWPFVDAATPAAPRCARRRNRGARGRMGVMRAPAVPTKPAPWLELPASWRDDLFAALLAPSGIVRLDNGGE